MWIFSVDDSRGKITKHHEKADASPPPPPAITQQIRFGNPPPLLDLINRFVRYIHSCDTVTEIVCGGKSWQSYNKTAETLGRRPDGEASGSPTGPPLPLY